MHIRHHQKDSCLRHFVGLRFKNPDTVAEVTLLQSWLRRYVIWNGCRKRHCLEDGLITQNWSARSELLRSVADVYIFKLVLQSCPSRGQSLAGMRQLQLALKNGRAFGTEFKGANYALGQLVFYRTKSQYKPKLDPNASRALMAGWKLEFGLSIG